MLKNLKKFRYSEEISIHNNKTLLVLATILFIEQLTYGVIFTDTQSIIGRTHLMTSGVSFAYMVILGSIYLQNRKQIKRYLWKDLLQFSYLFFGLGISIYRAVYISSTDFSIPVIYIAVLYGSAFLFYYPPIWSFTLYSLTFSVFLYLAFYENQNLLYPTFVQDIIVNNFLAWIGSLLAYQRFTQQIDSVILIEEQNKKLLELSETDTLTQLYNRRKIDEYLKKVHLTANSSQGVYVIVIADIDNFKQINDTYGHGVGDTVLVRIAEIFKDKIEDHHFLGRWGGEEFMIICNGRSLDEIVQWVERLREIIESWEFNVGRQVTCSFGISEFKRGLPCETVVENTDVALYRSKNNGRNMVTVN